MNDVAAFPLTWPEGWPRTASRVSASRFGDWTVFTATEQLLDELRRLGAKNAVISTSIPLRRDGIPYSRPPVDGDPGVAVYFSRKGAALCVPCDRYLDVADNIRAVTLAIEAMRALERHGTPHMLEAAFKGFAALPASAARVMWRDVLGDCRTLQEAEIRYRDLARVAHPDAGGSHEAMSALNASIEAAREELQPNGAVVSA
jgi:hypothetical protein